jgi:hypothetical protein
VPVEQVGRGDDGQALAGELPAAGADGVVRADQPEGGGGSGEGDHQAGQRQQQPQDGAGETHEELPLYDEPGPRRVDRATGSPAGPLRGPVVHPLP